MIVPAPLVLVISLLLPLASCHCKARGGDPLRPPPPGDASTDASDGTASGSDAGCQPSEDLLASARSALRSGALTIPLGPAGCLEYRRQNGPDGSLQSDSLVLRGKAVANGTFAPTEWSMAITAGQDIELRDHWTWSSNASAGYSRSIAEIATKSGTPRARWGYATGGSGLKVTEERVDATGSLVTIGSFSTGPVQNQSGAGSGPGGSGTCTAKEEDQLQRQLFAAFVLQDRCWANKLPEPMFRHWMATFYMHNAMRFQFRCYDTGTANASTELGRGPNDPVVINVYRNRFGALDSDQQTAALFHELLHHLFGPHNDNLASSAARYFELDRVYACDRLCTSTSRELTKCQCARCLDTDICDPRCALYRDCDPDMGAICPCTSGKNAFKHFDSCTTCLTACPSGLGCFGISHCRVLDFSCPGQSKQCP